MSLRQQWKFSYKANVLARAAAEKAQYHRERLDFWRLEQDTTQSEAREKGLLVHDYPVTGGRQVQMVVDPTIQGRLNECASKIDEHRRELDTYETFRRALELNGVTSLELDADDIRFFGL